QQPPVAQQPPQQGGATGGVGIAFEEEDGELFVTKVLPGSPAAQAGVKLEGVLRAVDDKSVKGMKLDEVRPLIGGQVGSLVKLTVEYDHEVTNYILPRADLSNAA